MISTSAHKTFFSEKNFDTLYKQLVKPFNEQIETVKQHLDHGIRNEALAIELKQYQFIINSKLKKPVKIRAAGIIIQSQIFDWVLALMGLFLAKEIQEIGLLEIKCSHNKINPSIKNIITGKKFYIVFNRDKKRTSIWLLHIKFMLQWD